MTSIDGLSAMNNYESEANLSANESPLSPSPRVISAISEHLCSLNRYPDKDGVDLRQILAIKLQLQSENIVLGNGSSEILDLSARSFLREGTDAIIGAPAFFPHHSVVVKAHGNKVVVPLKNFIYDLETMVEKITSNTRLIIIANPNNPTGTIVRRGELDHFLAQVPEHIVTVLDEAYYEYVQEKDFPVSLDYVRQGKNVLVLRTLSKAYGLAGLRIGYGAGSSSVIQQLDNTRQHYNTNQLAQVAAAVALDDFEYLQKSVELNTKGLRYLQEQLDQLQVEYVPSEANFLLVKVADGKTVTRQLGDCGIKVQAMDRYQLPEFIRVTVGLPEENERFIGAIAEIVNS
jgi:histidinol-phosphate aminotransferase